MYTYQYQKVDRHQEKLKGFSHAAFHFQRNYLQQKNLTLLRDYTFVITLLIP